MSENNFKKILIIRLSALGDTIHTLPLAYALKKQYPDIQLDWVVEDKASKFIINNPLIDNVYEIPKKKWKKNSNKIQNIKEFISIISKIKHEKYDIVIDTQQLLKSSVIMGLSSGKRKITLDCGREFSGLFANEIIKTGKKQFDINYHVVNRNLEIAKYLGCNDLNPEFVIPDFSKEFSPEIKDIIENLDKTRKTIVIAPATTWVNKHWQNNNWSEVIESFNEETNIILTAAEKEKNLIKDILDRIPDKKGIIDLSGMTNLADLVYIYENADIVITPDSGSCHIAWATGKPYIVSLFFATSANRTAPFGDKYFSLSANIPCSPCMKKKCINKQYLNKCCYEIKSSEIINIVKKVLQQK